LRVPLGLVNLSNETRVHGDLLLHARFK
jgi:hypothetical protein